MRLTFLSVSQNEAFARATVAAFVAQLDPTMDELTELKTVVSEAVTNAIIHGYQEQPDGEITIECRLSAEQEVEVTIKDEGMGMEDVQMAIEPLYTSKPELERSGMGFTIMESFMDKIEIESSLHEGTTIVMKKQLAKTKSVCH